MLLAQYSYGRLASCVDKETGLPNKDVPDWGKWIRDGDEYGFWNLAPVTYDVILPAGKRIVRYGNAQGRFSTDYGTAFEMLSLPYVKESLEYHEYIVMADCLVKCIVTKGLVAPGFKQPGRGIQYYHDRPMHESIRLGIIKEDYSWLANL